MSCIECGIIGWVACALVLLGGLVVFYWIEAQKARKTRKRGG